MSTENTTASVDEPRNFSSSQRATLFTSAGGHCQNCGTELEEGWHADHVVPYADGGRTDVSNGQALCPSCNLRKGVKGDGLRSWQREALKAWGGRDRFMLAACPGAGKTRFALTAAKQLLNIGRVRFIEFVVPARALVGQTIDTAADMGFELAPFSNRAGVARDVSGRVVTYQQVAAEPGLYRMKAAGSFVILDEAHHMGDDRTWGKQIQYAFEGAPHILLMTGTPWRSDGQAIPFAMFDQDDELVVDFRYGFAEAWTESVKPIRPVKFYPVDAIAEWSDNGVEHEATGAGITEHDETPVLNSFFDVDSEWVDLVLTKCRDELETVQRDRPDAQGLIIANGVHTANRYASACRQRGMSCTVIHGDLDGDPHADLEAFKRADTDWLIAVKMVGEGYDNPRLSVLAYASAERTELVFHQALGRVLRRAGGSDTSVARMVIPETPTFVRFAQDVETALLYALQDSGERRAADAGQLQPDELTRIIYPARNAVDGEAFMKGAVLDPPEQLRDMLGQLDLNNPQVQELIREARELSRVNERLDVHAKKRRRDALHESNRRLVAQIVNQHDAEYRFVYAALNRRYGTREKSERTLENLEDENRVLRRWLADGYGWELPRRNGRWS